MSNQYYNQKWQQAIMDLDDQIQLEMLPVDQSESLGKTYKRTDQEWFNFYAQLYIKYIDVFKQLEDCYDQIVHPQKRVLLREILDTTIIRLCETKYQLAKYNTSCDYTIKSDYVQLDEIVMDLKLMPTNLEIQIPRYFREEDKQRIQERNQMLDSFLLEFHETKNPEEEVFEEKSLVMDRQLAIDIIKKNEIGRQGIEKTYLAKIAKKQEQKLLEKKQRIKAGEMEDETQKENARLVLQKYCRGFIDRIKVQDMRQKELVFLGLKYESSSVYNQDNEEMPFINKKKKYDEDPKTISDFMNIQRKKLKLIQEEHLNEYQTALVDLKELVRKNEGSDIKEKLLDVRRKWVYEYIEQHDFNEVPQNADDFYEKDKVLDPVAMEKKLAQQEEEKKKASKKGDKKQGKGKGKGKGSELDEFNESHKPAGPSQQVLKLQEQIQSYNQQWKKDETNNFEQKYDNDMAKHKVKPDVETEVKSVVDQMIDIELDNLRLQYGKKKKKQKKKKQKKKKEKKKKFPGDLANKGRDPKDILAQLVDIGVAKKLLPAKVSDLIGDANPLGQAQERASQAEDPQKVKFQTLMPDPSIQQIRQVLTEYVALPLGSQYLHQQLEKNIFFLFYGAPGTGKTLAIRALATECNALVLDITPSNIEGKFTEKKQLDGCINAVFRVAKEFQPALIVCDEFEQIFQGKKKKGVPQNAFFAKMKKPIMDFKKLKFLQPEDRVAFIATSTHPFDGSVKDMKNFFDKKFYFPYPSYGTIKLLIEKFVDEKGIEIPPNFPLNTFTFMCQYYPAGSIQRCIEQFYAQNRSVRLKAEQAKQIEQGQQQSQNQGQEIQKSPLKGEQQKNNDIIGGISSQNIPLTQDSKKSKSIELKTDQIKLVDFIGPLSQQYMCSLQDIQKFKQFTDEVCRFKELRDKKRNPQDDNKKNANNKNKDKK